MDTLQLLILNYSFNIITVHMLYYIYIEFTMRPLFGFQISYNTEFLSMGRSDSHYEHLNPGLTFRLTEIWDERLWLRNMMPFSACVSLNTQSISKGFCYQILYHQEALTSLSFLICKGNMKLEKCEHPRSEFAEW